MEEQEHAETNVPLVWLWTLPYISVCTSPYIGSHCQVEGVGICLQPGPWKDQVLRGPRVFIGELELEEEDLY